MSMKLVWTWSAAICGHGDYRESIGDGSDLGAHGSHLYRFTLEAAQLGAAKTAQDLGATPITGTSKLPNLMVTSRNCSK